MQIVRVPGFGCDYGDARYYGWRHQLHLAFWLIFWGLMTDAELQSDHDLARTPARLALLRRCRDAMSRRDPDGISEADWNQLLTDIEREIGVA